jgi:hypothetical protein
LAPESSRIGTKKACSWNWSAQPSIASATVAALDVDELNEPWANGRTRIQAGPFEHITADTNR